MSRLRQLSDDYPVAIGGSVEIVLILAAAVVVIALNLDPNEVAGALVVLAGANAAITRKQHNNAIPLPKMRKHPDSRQADPDEQHAP